MAKSEIQKSKSRGPSTQGFLAISEVRENLIVMPGGGVRAVIAVSSTDFVLKSQEEQNAIIGRYQAFLNTLDFPIQILIQSRKLDIHGYLEKIKERQLAQTNELLRIMTEEYAEYIRKLLDFGNIMNKTFYVVVPYSTGDVTQEGFIDKLKNIINPTQKLAASQEKFMEMQSVVDDRIGRVENGLGSVGLRTMRLNTEEIVELLFKSYNLGVANEAVVDMSELNLQ